jgi:hypothetical protein
MSCPSNLIRTIRPTENIGSSLITLNNNFWSVGTTLCNLKERLENQIRVRTFFYYGPNAGTDPTSGMDDNKVTRPSNITIQNFVNSNQNLDLAANSKLNDQVYVIYQKTGYQRSFTRETIAGSFPVSVQKISSEVGTATAHFSINFEDYYDTRSPVFIIWKLTAKLNTNSQLKYTVDSGFPKFTQAETFSTNFWKSPNLWTSTF